MWEEGGENANEFKMRVMVMDDEMKIWWNAFYKFLEKKNFVTIRDNFAPSREPIQNYVILVKYLNCIIKYSSIIL